MYQYKRNQLQIMPKYRKLFRGDGDTVYVQFYEKKWINLRDGYLKFYWEDQVIEEMTWYDPPFRTEQEFIEYKKVVKKERLVNEYKYVYVTNTPELQGDDSDGIYYNWTTHLPTMKRKMKRLLRCHKLNLVFVDDLDAAIRQAKKQPIKC